MIGLLPWVVFAIAAVVETIRGWKAEGRSIFDSEDGFDVFLLLWLTIPIVFFSFSQSKLPGYILPALPAATLLIASYVRRRISSGHAASKILLLFHAVITGIIFIPCFLISYIVLVHRLPWGKGTLAASILGLLLGVGVFTALNSRFGLRLLHFATLVPVLLSVAAIIRLGGPALDQEDSARTVAASLTQTEGAYGVASPLPVAVFEVGRQTEYGLHFYRNSPVSSYDRGEIPTVAHLLVTKEGAESDIAHLIGSRIVIPIGSSPDQHLEYYQVSSAGTSTGK